ncbi:hypothetical protein Pan44_41540 [Caulifigura coniformis]|uniref:DUF983 domain-containing protein n=1 Tax=Caulifigura coniformis TaxID=2527983 RepID=A0A517SIY9_9PLAN|nr:DUF983 domain-containing protein [Caulifigura coniformis]QDT56103.1 hypothetical protein Pan44_41540 [Caulifigura coniformis]
MTSETPDDRPAIRRWTRPEYPTLVQRALKLRCPRCGEGQLFSGFFRMHERCSSCGLKYERAPGYYLGSSYVNYGLTAVALLIAYIILHYKLGYSNQQLAGPLAGFCVIFPLLAFRYARALWLAMDCRWDPAMMTDEED